MQTFLKAGLSGLPIARVLFRVVAQDGRLQVGLGSSGPFDVFGIAGPDFRLFQAFLDGHCGVVRAKHLGRQPGQQAGEIGVDIPAADVREQLGQVARRVKLVVVPLAGAGRPGIADQFLHVAPHRAAEGQRFVPLHRVFAQEMELGRAVGVEGDVLGTKGGGAHGICLVGLLFIAHPQAQGVNEVTRRGEHSLPGIGSAQILGDLGADGFQLGVKLDRFVEFMSFPFLFDGRGIAQPHVFELARELVLPTGHPERFGLPDDLGPVARRDRRVGTEVERDVALAGAFLPASP